MNRVEFKEIMKKLVTEYTVQGKDPPYGEERVEAIFQAFKLYNGTQFSAVVQRSFAECRVAPLAKDLLKIASEIESEIRTKEKALHKFFSEKETTLPKEESLKRVGDIIQKLTKRFPEQGADDGQKENAVDRDVQEIL